MASRLDEELSRIIEERMARTIKGIEETLAELIRREEISIEDMGSLISRLRTSVLSDITEVGSGDHVHPALEGPS